MEANREESELAEKMERDVLLGASSCRFSNKLQLVRAFPWSFLKSTSEFAFLLGISMSLPRSAPQVVTQEVAAGTSAARISRFNRGLIAVSFKRPFDRRVVWSFVLSFFLRTNFSTWRSVSEPPRKGTIDRRSLEPRAAGGLGFLERDKSRFHKAAASTCSRIENSTESPRSIPPLPLHSRRPLRCLPIPPPPLAS